MQQMDTLIRYWSKLQHEQPQVKKAPLNKSPHLSIELPLHAAIYRFFTYPLDYFSKSRVKGEKLAEAGFYMASDMKSLLCHFCDLKIIFLFGWKNLNVNQMLLKHKKLSPRCIFASAGCNNNAPMGKYSHLTNYKAEAHRLFSLMRSEVQHLWQHVDPFDLARWGFYYAGNADNVRCAFCNLEVRGWEEGDTAEGEHRRWNQDCCFLQQSAFTGNIKIGDELSDVSFESKIIAIQSKYSTLKSRADVIILSESSLGIIEIVPARHSKFAAKCERVNSFANWPKSMVQQPRELAEAGFFYIGIGDHVSCFQCGLGLKDWVSGDNEWEQHVKWSPSCAFVLMAKGASFVNQKLHCSTEIAPMDGVEQTMENKSDSVACRECRVNDCCVSLPCGHMFLCVDCGEVHTNCAECGHFILASLIVFLN